MTRMFVFFPENIIKVTILIEVESGYLPLSSLPTCRNICHALGIWHKYQVRKPFLDHNPVALHRVSGRMRQTQWHPGIPCSVPG